MTPNDWKNKIRHKLIGISSELEKFRQMKLPYYVYGTIAGLTLWPLVENVATTGQLIPAISVLYSTVAGVGTNLVANQIEQWKKQTDGVTQEEVTIWLAQESAKNAKLRDTIDTLVEKMETIPQVRSALDENEASQFVTNLREELKDLGNINRFASILVEGDQATVYAGSVSVEGDVNAPINTGSLSFAGDNQKTIHTNLYIERQTLGSQSTLPVGILREAYLNRLFNQVSVLDLAGIDPKSIEASNTQGMKLTAVYTALTTIGEQSRLTADNLSRISAISELNKHKRLIILGYPGSGKSTFVRFITMCMAGELIGRQDAGLSLLTSPLPTNSGEVKQHWSHGPLVPVLVYLRELVARLPQDFSGQSATVAHLWDYIQEDLKAAGLENFLPELQKMWLLEEGILFLDGLDEVPEANQQREFIRNLIRLLAQTYPKVRIVVTSRTYAYQNPPHQLSEFMTTQLDSFSENQIRYFVDAWYKSVAKLRNLSLSDMQGRAEQLKLSIFNNRYLNELAKRPLLLTLIASLHTWRGGNLPQYREELYAYAVDLLLDWWEAPKVIRNEQGKLINPQPSLSEWLQVDREKVRQLINRLAFEAHSSQLYLQGMADISQNKLISALLDISQNPDTRPQRLIEYLSLRAGLLLPNGTGAYTFPHRSIQEYLAACYLTDDEFPDKLAELTRTDPDRWREVALLAGAKAARGSASTVWSLAEALCYESYAEGYKKNETVWGALIAGQMLAESAQLEKVSIRNQSKLKNIRDWLVKLLRDPKLPAVERAEAASSLATLGDPRIEVIDVDAMQFCYVPKGPFFMGAESYKDLDQLKPYEAQLSQHILELPYDFWLARYPVTNAQFAQFVQDHGYENPLFWSEAQKAQVWKDGKIRGKTWVPESLFWEYIEFDRPYELPFPFNLPNHPIVGVTWYEALAFAQWLTLRWKSKGLLPHDYQVCLPSEAEWEKAAKGGLEIPKSPRILSAQSQFEVERSVFRNNEYPKRRFPWGDQLSNEYVNWKDSSIGATNGAGCFSQGSSPYGCQEMAGNVLEWTRSLWGPKVDKPDIPYPYLFNATREGLDAKKDVARTLRGGHWRSDEQWFTCTSRSANFPDHRFVQIVGFRICILPKNRVMTI